MNTGKKRYRFLYDGDWTCWFEEGDKLDLFLIDAKNVDIDAIEVTEYMTREQFDKLVGSR